MLPDPLDSALPAIVRGAVRVAPDPRLSPGYEWPAAERPHVVALAYERGPVHHLAAGVHRLSPATGAHKNPAKRKP